MGRIFILFENDSAVVASRTLHLTDIIGQNDAKVGAKYTTTDYEGNPYIKAFSYSACLI